MRYLLQDFLMCVLVAVVQMLLPLQLTSTSKTVADAVLSLTVIQYHKQVSTMAAAHYLDYCATQESEAWLIMQVGLLLKRMLVTRVLTIVQISNTRSQIRVNVLLVLMKVLTGNTALLYTLRHQIIGDRPA